MATIDASCPASSEPNAADFAITLGELKALGRFVRCQELDARIPELVAAARIEPGFPLAPARPLRTPPAKEIDLFDGNRWRRVEFIGLDTRDHIHFRDGSEDKRWTFNRAHVAPAGLFSRWQGDTSRGTEARLLDTFVPAHSWHTVHDWKVEHGDGAYVTFQVRSLDPHGKWQDHVTRSYTLHLADPRVSVPGVTPLEPAADRPIAVSHRWLSPDHPDRDGKQHAELVATCERLGLHASQLLLIDWCALPQRPRTRSEAARFRRELPVFQGQYARRTIVLNEGADDYRQRGWCMLELMLASLRGAVMGSDRLSPALTDAYRQATEYTKVDRWHGQNISRVRGDARAMLSNMEMLMIHDARRRQHDRIVEMFEHELEVADRRDIPVLVSLLKTLVFGEGSPAR